MAAAHSSQLGKMGFGVAGPLASRFFPAAKTEQLIETAIDCGIRFFDTGPSYGGGEAERRLGIVLARAQRNKLFITTKAGVTEDGQRNFTPNSLYESLLRSLGRLQLEYVDGLFLHGLTRSDFSDELLHVLERMKSEGLVRALGVVGRKWVMELIFEQYPQFELIMLQMGPKHLPENMTVANCAKQAGRTVIGIEMLAHTRKPFRWSLNPADLWYMARYLRRGGTYSKQDTMEVLRRSLANPHVDVVLTSSTKSGHVQDWQSCLDECVNAS